MLVALAGVAAGGIYGASVYRSMSLDSNARDARERGMELYAKATADDASYDLELVEDAMYNLSTYIGRFKNDAEALLALANCRRSIPIDDSPRHLRSALNFVSQALALEPESLEALQLRLEIAREMPEYLSETLSAADAVLERLPEDREAQLTRVQVFVALGQADEARDAAELLSDSRPDDSDAFALYLQLSFEADGDLEAVVQRAADAAGEHEGSRGYGIIYARWLAASGQVEEARALSVAVASEPVEDPAELRQLMQLLESLDLFDESADVLARSVAAFPDSAAIVDLRARRLWQSGRPDLAGQVFRDANAAASTFEDDALGFAASLAATGQEGLDRYIAELEARTSAEAAAWQAVATGWRSLLGDASDFDRGPLENASQLLADEALPLLVLARRENQLGEWRLAIGSYTAALGREPRWLMARLDLCELTLRQGQPSIALQQAREALNQHPNSVAAIRAFNQAGTVIAETGAWGLPRMQLLVERLEREVDVIEPSRAGALACLVRVHAVMGDREAAQDALDRFNELDQRISTEALAPMTQAALAAGLSGIPDADEIRGGVLAEAFELLRTGRAAEGRALLEEAAADGDPQRARDLVLFLDQAQAADTIELARKTSEEHADNAAILSDLLRIGSVWSDADLVETLIARLRSIGGDRAAMWRLFEARRRIELDGSGEAVASAVELLAPLLQGETADADALLLYAEAVSELGDPSAGLDALRRAARLAPARPEIRAQLVGSLMRVGNVTEAEQELTQYRQMTRLTGAQRRERIALLLNLGMVNEAARDASELSRSDLPADLALRARVVAVQGDLELADRLFAAAIESGLREREYVLQAMRVALSLGDAPRARSYLTRLADSEEGAAEEWARFVLVVRLDHLAAEAAQAIDAEDPGTAMLALRLALRSGEQSLISAALASAQPSVLSALEASGSLSAPAHEVADLVADLLAPVPGNEAGLELLTRFGTAMGSDRVRVAGEMLELARRIGGSGPLWELAARGLLAAGDAEGAVAALRRGSRNVPLNVQLPRLGTYLAIERAGAFEDAIELARIWKQRTNDRLQATVAEAMAASRLERWRVAADLLEPFEDELLSESTGDVSLGLFAHTLAFRGRVAEAEALLEARLGSSRIVTRSFTTLPDRVGEPAERRALLQRIGSRLESDPVGTYLVAAAWNRLALDESDEAASERAAEIALSVAGTANVPHAAYRIAGQALMRLDRADEAEAAFRAVLAADDTDLVTLNDLAFLLTGIEGRADESAELSARALDVAERLGLGGETLATVLSTRGGSLLATLDPEAALAAFDRASLAATTGSPLHRSIELGACLALAQSSQIDEAAARLGRLRLSETEVSELEDSVAARYEALQELLGNAR